MGGGGGVGVGGAGFVSAIKNFLPLKVTDIQYLQECIKFEMKIRKKLCNFIILYRLPSQSQDDFETFLKNFALNLDIILANNPYLTVVLSDFNVKSNLLRKSDTRSYEGSKIEGVTSQFGIINEQTHHTSTT